QSVTRGSRPVSPGLVVLINPTISSAVTIRRTRAAIHPNSSRPVRRALITVEGVAGVSSSEIHLSSFHQIASALPSIIRVLCPGVSLLPGPGPEASLVEESAEAHRAGSLRSNWPGFYPLMLSFRLPSHAQSFRMRICQSVSLLPQLQAAREPYTEMCLLSYLLQCS